MSITDELRKYADTLSERARCGATIPSPFNPHSGAPIGPTRETEELYAIANRIDEKHYDVQADAFDEGANYAFNNPTLFGLIPSPKDVNGEYIRIGDRMEHIELGYVLEVIAVGIDCFIAWNTHANCYCQYDSTLFRHQHEPTVEDVLKEMCDALNDARMPLGSGMISEEIIAKYAAKLQLRGDGE